MKYMMIILKSYFMVRIANLFSILFIICLLMHLSKGQEKFISFLKDWKITVIFSFLTLSIHLMKEFSTALEDYIYDVQKRNTSITLFWTISIITFIITAVTIELV